MRLRVEPGGFDIDAESGETVMGAATSRGYYWPTTCGGEARCTTCASQVLQGGGNLSEMGRAERKAFLENRGAVPPGVRLACQAQLLGDVVVRKAGVRPPGE